MVPLSAFYSRILPQVVGCPEPLMQQALVDSAIHFCEQSLVVEAPLDNVALGAGVNNIELDLPSQQRLAQVLEVRLDDRVLAPVARSNFYPGDGATGMPTRYTTTDLDEQLVLTLYPAPDKAYELRTKVATKPARNATSVASVLYENYAETIVDGALARLLAMPEQNFTNEPKAMLLEQRVRRVVAEARIDASRGRVRTSLTAQPRPFA